MCNISTAGGQPDVKVSALRKSNDILKRMIASRLLHHLLLGVTLISGAASAVELGEITLHSRIGEALRAEIPVSTGGNPPDPACFSLAPLPGADFPVITGGRIRVVHVGQGYRLIIIGSKVIEEPVIAINLRAGCGLALQREYVLLPGPPLAPPTNNIEIATSGAPRQAESRQPARYSQLTDSASNNFSSDDFSEPPPAKPKVKRRTKKAAAKPKAPLPPDTLAGLGSGHDKIVLGAALDELLPPSAGEPLSPAYEINERVLKMETTLHLLNQEVEKLNTALNLGAESRAMREKLQDMQARQATSDIMPSAQAAQSPATARSRTNHDGWLELLFGLLLGGTVSAGVAHLVSRRQEKSRAFAAHRQTEQAAETGSHLN